MSVARISQEEEQGNRAVAADPLSHVHRRGLEPGALATPSRGGRVTADRPYGRWQSERGMWLHVRSVTSRFSDWVVVHPVLWGVGLGVVLVLLGVALDLAPIVVIAAGATIGLLNILHAKRRGYCPLPAEPGPHPGRAEAE